MKEHLQNSEYAAVDIGGTNTRFALFDKYGNIIKKNKTQTDYRSAERTCDWIIEQIKKYEIKYLALCIPGPSDYQKGIVLKSPNLAGSWVNFDVRSYLMQTSTLSDIVFENDANVMALANHVKANGFNSDKISQFFTISTGFGAGLIIDNKIYHGRDYYAQEIAQLPASKIGFYQEHRLKNPYALELHCSGSGIETKAKALSIANSAKEVFELAKNNDAKAMNLIKEASDVLTNIFATCAALLSPHNFYIGGSLALAQKDFVIGAFEKAKLISDPNHFKDVKLIFDQHGDDSALIGLYYLTKMRNNMDN
ncbi:ROK family protein [Mycoplasma sp. AC1221]